MKNKRKNLVAYSALVAILILSVVLGLGITNAWFTGYHKLDGNGTTPNVSIQVYNDTTVLNSVLTYDQVTKDDKIAENINFKYSGTNINILARFSVTVDVYNNGTRIDDATAADWYTKNLGSNWTYSDGWYYYNSVLSQSASTTAVVILQDITIVDDNATGKDFEVTVLVEAVQANQTGIDLFKGTNNQYTLPDSYTNGTILG